MSLFSRWRRSSRSQPDLRQDTTPISRRANDPANPEESDPASSRVNDRVDSPTELSLGDAGDSLASAAIVIDDVPSAAPVATLGDSGHGQEPVSVGSSPVPIVDQQAAIPGVPATSSSISELLQDQGSGSPDDARGDRAVLRPLPGLTPRIAARQTVVGVGADERQLPTAPPHGSVVEAAYGLFERNDPEGARAMLESVAFAGPLEAAGRDLLDVLLPSDAALGIIDAVVRHNDHELSLLERSHWLARRFDSASKNPLAQREAALDLLGAATMAGEAGWQLVQQPDRRARLDDALSEPGAQIDLLEQEALAPAETGLPGTVPGRTLAFGRLMAARGELGAVRDAERLLHVLREPQLAYLLENDRKRWGGGFRTSLTAPRPVIYPGSRLTVVLAGGHPPLRRLARRELDEMDLADVREFPSAWEGNRQGRHARDTVEGSDLAVVIWRQIAHSTSDQITSAARSLSIPVVRADTPTISAIRRAVTQFKDSTTRRPEPARP